MLSLRNIWILALISVLRTRAQIYLRLQKVFTFCFQQCSKLKKTTRSLASATLSGQALAGCKTCQCRRPGSVGPPSHQSPCSSCAGVLRWGLSEAMTDSHRLTWVTAPCSSCARVLSCNLRGTSRLHLRTALLPQRDVTCSYLADYTPSLRCQLWPLEVYIRRSFPIYPFHGNT